jgi:hypothetical protein
MEAPFIIYTNMYTLEGKDPKTNKYVDMYLLWLTNLIKYSKFQKTDICVTFMDEETHKYLNVNKSEKFNIYQTLKHKFHKFIIIKYPPPKTHKEGMLRKYSVDVMLDYTASMQTLNPIYMYLDIDVLIVNDIRKLNITNFLKDDRTSLFLRTESNKIEHSDYFGDLMTEEDKTFLIENKIRMPGFSAGIFGWQNNIHIRDFLNYILKQALESNKEFYTIEQPFFNAALFHYILKDNSKFLLVIMSRDSIGHNVIGAHLIPDVVLVNYCGEPTDESLHWTKMYHQMLIQMIHDKPCEFSLE